MKKSFLALGAAVALGSLGFAGSANAAWYFGDGDTAHTNLDGAESLALNPGSTGHMLFTPYYSAQGSTATLFNITNTDNDNGKAVKVRFRSASNSDDVLDFTVFLSPGDVWSASVSRGADGLGRIKTSDNSCTLPAQGAGWPVSFNTQRMPASWGDDVQAINANEGYIEVLNMADIPATALDDDGEDITNPLYTNIKHVNGVAPCKSGPFAALLNTTGLGDDDDALEIGLAAPTGGLMGTWVVMKQDQLATFSGNMSAIVATTGDVGADGVTPERGYAKIAFAPQRGVPVGNSTVVIENTADPLLHNDPDSALWFDLPDMSTPIVGTDASAQALALSTALGRTSLMNDYAASADGASVPMDTDWVVSQPTRRYHATLSYGTGTNGADEIMYSTGDTSEQNPYDGLLTARNTDYGTQACMLFKFSSTDREEAQVETSVDADFSPGTFVTNPYCGEVFTLSFGSNSPLGAVVTNRKVSPVGTEGWAHIGTDSATAIPMVGYAATVLLNQNSGVHYGWTLPHRWVD